VETVWAPFFTACNVMGETNLPSDVLGAPIRLAKGKDGEVKFSQSGRPVMRVHKDLNDQVNIVRENFVAGLQAYTGSVQEERPDAYSNHVAAQQAAGQPLMEQDQADIVAALEQQAAQEQAESDAQGETPSGEGDPASEPDASGKSSRAKKPEAEPAHAAA
jgi:hypothetical protein